MTASSPPPDTRAAAEDPRLEVEHAMAALRRRSIILTVARVASYLAYAWVIVSLVILAFGFFLLLFAANPDAPFAEWVYRHLADTMEPFRGIFPQQQADGGATLDVSVLFAMFVYTLIALAVRSAIDWLTYRRDRVAHQLARNEDYLRRTDARRSTEQQRQVPTTQQSPPRQSPPAW